MAVEHTLFDSRELKGLVRVGLPALENRSHNDAAVNILDAIFFQGDFLGAMRALAEGGFSLKV